ncbi:MAG: OmpA family protein [Pseudomonadota bacterium]
MAATGWWAVHGGPTNARSLEANLERQVDAALEAAGLAWADVQFDGQKAILFGQSPSHDSVQRAVDTVMGTVMAGGYLIGGVTSLDVQVAAAPPVSPYTWQATRGVENGLTLSGYVPSREIMAQLIMDAEAIAPGEVTNTMRLASGEPSGDWLAAARIGLLQLDEMPGGTVTLTDSRLLLEGRLIDPAVRNRVVAAVQRVAPPYAADARISGGGLWRAEHKDGDLILTGRVRSPAERNELNALAAEYFDGTVRDNMEISNHGHEDWLDGVRIALPHFAGFQSGTLAFDPEGDGYRVEGDATDSLATYLTGDLQELDSRFEIVQDIRVVDADLAELAAIDFTTDPQAACAEAFDTVLSVNRISFENGASVITRDSGAALDKLLAIINRCPAFSFRVSGHTDAYGDRSFNIRLSEDRAGAVVDYLAARGVAKTRLDPVGLGPDQPIADNTTRTGRAANRRIEIEVIEGS